MNSTPSTALVHVILPIEKEILELQQWKKEAMEILCKMDLQAIGEELNIKVGESVHDKILPGIRQLKAQLKSGYGNAN